jgi:hypothetical protein
MTCLATSHPATAQQVPTEGIDQEREAMLKLVNFPVE